MIVEFPKSTHLYFSNHLAEKEKAVFFLNGLIACICETQFIQHKMSLLCKTVVREQFNKTMLCLH